MSEETTNENATADPNAIFRMGTWIGKPFDEIENSGVFGKRITPRVRRGSWNVPHRLDYAGAIGSDNPYETHVGFFDNKEAGYILFQKRSMSAGNTLNDAEVTGLLFKIASGGTWDKGTEGQQRSLRPSEDDDSEGPDYAGTFYTYTHRSGTKEKPGDIFHLFAYRLHNKRQLLIWPPAVTPNLGGSSFAPPSKFEGLPSEELLEEPPAEDSNEDAPIEPDPFGASDG